MAAQKFTNFDVFLNAWYDSCRNKSNKIVLNKVKDS